MGLAICTCNDLLCEPRAILLTIHLLRVANYLMAKAGYATTALAAVYAGPMFNLMFGLGVAGIAGFIKYGEGLPVVPELQLYLGVIFIVISLTLGVVFSSMQRFTRTHAYIFYGVYTAFLIVTISVNLA